MDRRNIDDSSFFTLPDRLALLEDNMTIFDNMKLSLKLSRQLCKQQHFD